jgi:glutamine amidotransferase
LKVLASKLKASLFFAHVRDATPGIPVSQANCHPFALGRYLFMHNGAIKPFHALRRPLLNQLSDQAFHAIQGNTDSELVFALLLERLHFQHDASLSNIIEALRETVALLLDTIQTHAPEGHASLNLGLSNGEWMLATRYTSMPDKSPISLFVSHGHLSCPSDGDFSLSDCHFPSEEATIIASEPLTDNERAWEEVPPSSIVIAHRHQRPRMEPLVL